MARACTVLLIAAALSACEGLGPQELPRSPMRPELSQTRTVVPRPTAHPAPGPLQLPEEQQVQVPPFIARGTGSFVAAPPTSSQSIAALDPTGGVTLNAVDADIREVLTNIFDELLGSNYIIDPRVQGQITLNTSRPVPITDLLSILDAALRMNGAALIKTDNLYKVVPIQDARTSGLSTDIQPDPRAGHPGFGLKIVPLRYVSADRMAALLQPFASADDPIQVDRARNLLLLGGNAAQLSTLQEIATIFDVDWMKGMSFGLFPLSVATPSQLVKELEAIFNNTEDGPLTDVLRFVPIERINAILVMSSQSIYLDQASTWIERLDRQAEGQQARTYVYSVQNGRAGDLAQVLSAMLDASGTTLGPPNLLRPGLEPVEIHSAAPMEPALQGESRPNAQMNATLSRPRIIADETTNSLIIHAAYADYRDIRSALDKLDLRPLQVLIEATIAEVTLKNELRFGVDWFLRAGDFRASFSSAASGAIPTQLPGFSAILKGTDVVSVLNALEAITDVNVISSPQLLVLDNQTAELQVGDQVPIITQQAQNVQGGDSPILQTIEQVPTGVILTVLPRVNSSGLVIMEITQEVSDAIETVSSSINSPTISRRKVKSTVAVQDGETIALGGLIRDNVDKRKSGVPLLSRLPILGGLFGVTNKGTERTELLVLITPTVVGSVEEARLVTEELRRRIRAVAPLSDKL